METSGTVAIKKNMKKINSVTYSLEGSITFSGDKLIIEATNIMGLDDLMNNCYGKVIIKIEYEGIEYDDQDHPFEGYTTYTGGVEEWFTYRLYTFHFDDGSSSTIEVGLSSPDGSYPNVYFAE